MSCIQYSTVVTLRFSNTQITRFKFKINILHPVYQKVFPDISCTIYQFEILILSNIVWVVKRPPINREGAGRGAN